MAVADSGSLTRAAEECNVALSALSETIKQIEEDTGVTLFDRSQRPLVVTQFGEYFVRDAREILARFNQSVRGMRDFGGKERGRIAISGSPSMVALFAIPTMQAFLRLHPGIEFSVHSENAKQVQESVRKGLTEIGIHEKWEDGAGLGHQPLITDRYGLICSPHHPFASRRSVRLEELKEELFVLLTSDSGIRYRIESSVALRGKIMSKIETSDAASLLSIVGNNLGISIMPYLALKSPFFFLAKCNSFRSTGSRPHAPCT